MKEKVTLIFDSQDSESAIQFLKKHCRTTKAASAFNDVMRHAYWNK